MEEFQIEVGDRITYIETRIVIDENRNRMSDVFPTFALKTKEVKNKVTKIVTSSDMEFKEVLKIERIGQKGWYTVYKKELEILDEKEKEYLSAVIKPFKNRVESIIKRKDNTEIYKFNKETEFILIMIKDAFNIVLPNFKAKTMYKNMKLEKEYSLKKLGLEEKI